MSEFTKGEWEVCPQWRHEVYCGNIPIADTLPSDQWSSDTLSSSEIYANARLIASAPDLLEACEQLIEKVSLCDIMDKESWDEVDKAVVKAQTAIKKAKGETE